MLGPVLSRCFGGLCLDVKRKLPWFLSDFYDGFHIQSISAILFIYLGCITNAITFGGLLGDATDHYQVCVQDMRANLSKIRCHWVAVRSFVL